MLQTSKQTLVIPGLLKSRRDLSFQQAPALAKWLKRAAERQVTADYYELLLQLFGYPLSRYDLAQLRAKADGLDPTQHWLCADPLHVGVDVVHVYSMGQAYLNITEAEVQELTESLNAYLSDDCYLIAPHPLRWYLRIPEAWQFDWVSPEQVFGKTLRDKLPQHPRVKQLFNELQMLLHDHPVNMQRRHQQLPTIDALWLWGSGQSLPPRSPLWNAVMSDDPVVVGLAQLQGIPCIASEAQLARESVLHVNTQFNDLDASDICYDQFQSNSLQQVQMIYIGNGLAYERQPWWKRCW